MQPLLNWLLRYTCPCTLHNPMQSPHAAASVRVSVCACVNIDVSAYAHGTILSNHQAVLRIGPGRLWEGKEESPAIYTQIVPPSRIKGYYMFEYMHTCRYKHMYIHIENVNIYIYINVCIYIYIWYTLCASHYAHAYLYYICTQICIWIYTDTNVSML